MGLIGTEENDKRKRGEEIEVVIKEDEKTTDTDINTVDGGGGFTVRADIDDLKMPELKKYAKENNIPVPFGIRKVTLIEAIKNHK